MPKGGFREIREIKPNEKNLYGSKSSNKWGNIPQPTDAQIKADDDFWDREFDRLAEEARLEEERKKK